MQKVRAVGGVFFKCSHPEELAAWYKKYLGFNLEAPFCAGFDLQDSQPGDKTVWGAFNMESNYFQPSKQEFMLNLIVDDVEKMLQQVKAGGARIVDEVLQEEYGTFGWFIDPQGFKVELWTPPKVSNES